MTIILILYGVSDTRHPYGLLCAAGLLLTVFTIESLLDEESSAVTAAKLVLVACCCALSSGFLMFLLFGEVKGKTYRPVLPAVIFALWKLAAGRRMLEAALPIMIARTLILIAASVVLWWVQRFADRYMDSRRQANVSMDRLALSEFEERKLNQSLLIQSAIAERNARLEEREHISRSIHNSVGHTITAASVALEAAEVLWNVDADRALEKVRTANGRIQQGLSSIRHAVRVLDAAAEDISIDDFVLELKVIADKFMMDTDCQVHWDLEILAPELAIAHAHTEFLTGAVQELLVNGVRHGRADQFTMQLLADSGHIRITVTDNGAGDFDGQNAYSRIQKGFGLKKMIKYVEKNGGTAAFTNEGGFRAVITMPVN